MTKSKDIRLSKAARQLNVGTSTVVEFLATKGVEIKNSPNSKISPDQFTMLKKEFSDSIANKQEADEMTIGTAGNDVVISTKKEEVEEVAPQKEEEEVLKIKTARVQPKREEQPKKAPEAKKEEPKPEPKAEEKKPEPVAEKKEEPAKEEAPKKEEPKPEPKAEEKKPEPVAEKKEEPVKEEALKKEEEVETKKGGLQGLKVLGKIDLPDPREKKKGKRGKKENKKSVDASKKQKPAPKKEQPKPKAEEPKKPTPEKEQPKAEKPKVEEKKEEKKEQEEKIISGKADKLQGLKVVGKIELPTQGGRRGGKGGNKSDDSEGSGRRRRRRRRRRKDEEGTPQTSSSGSSSSGNNNKSNNSNNNNSNNNRGGNNSNSRGGRGRRRNEPSKAEVDSNLKATLAQMNSGGNRGGRTSQRRNARKERRAAHARAHQEQLDREAEEAKILKVTEFVSANELAGMMDVSVNEIISTCFSMGVIVTINQRLEADTITIIADEFGFDVEFTTADDEIEVAVEEDKEEDLLERPPIVTIMGHVDHGKTTLLDYIRDAKVAAGEAGGITQHIGAYQVQTDDGRKVTFLDTPGHAAFTAMRARGARLTDIAIIVVAADDGVMPQTKEAINHAQVGDVPIVIAINKIDKPAANPSRVKQELAEMNVLIEEYGGDVQCQEISAKTGQGIDDLLEAVLLAAEVLELKANPDKKGIGAVIEASLDKGRGYVSTMLVQAGTINVGDVILAGSHYGKIRAMTDHRGKRLKVASPSMPVQILGLDGAPQAGDQFNIMDTDREAREIAGKRQQILREQTVRATRRLTLSDIGRRKALGNFQQLNLVLKGDVDGSVEAISDALLKLSNDEVEVNIVHKGVGPVSESDILLASTAEAIVIAFQVRPSRQSRTIADQENIEIRTYSIIYKVIDDVKDAIEGMLSPEIQEEVVGNVEIRETFKISKVGTIAGCYVTNGYVKRHAQIRLIREGVVVHTGKIDTLKRYKDDVTEVKHGFECGLTLDGYNDIKVGDELEVFEEREVKRKLEQVESSAT